MADAKTGAMAVDPGLGADLLAAISDGDSRRSALRERVDELRDIGALGGLSSVQRVRSAILNCAADAASSLDTVLVDWSTVTSAIRESAWRGLANDADRWRGEFVVERIERPVSAAPSRELSSTPPRRFYSFAHPESVSPGEGVHISGESPEALTFADIERGLHGAEPAVAFVGAARWRYFASILDSSVDPVEALVRERGQDDAAVAATGVSRLVYSSRRIAARWSTIGNAIQGFGLGLRHAAVSISALRDERDKAMAACDADAGLVAQRLVLWEDFERRARTSFDETYGAGLFAFTAGLTVAGRESS